ncbi:MAG: CRISPR-associated protein Cas5 [Planctomycetales bacterium]|nr:CRISPR-associated protein Cas5 [Planctomycetales bacterium]MCA9197158.1 CRISPR-associated protein Cas5 [Planctomycetales bacterium]
MDDLAIFETRGPIAHFRRPDTLGTHASYPFFTRTSLRGLIASVLGLQSLPDETLCGLQLLNPVRTVTHELSMHGKTWEAGSGAQASFSRPTSIELIVNPAYRVFYLGEHVPELESRMSASRSQYHTYLGAAYCLTFPRWITRVASHELVSLAWEKQSSIETSTIVPSKCVRKLEQNADRQYARVGGMLYEHLGERRFRGSINMLYEVTTKPMTFQPAQAEINVQFVSTQEFGVVCLW